MKCSIQPATSSMKPFWILVLMYPFLSMYDDKRAFMRVKNSLPSALSKAIGLNSPGEARSSDLARSTTMARCQLSGTVCSFHTRCMICTRISSTAPHFLYTMKGIAFSPGEFRFRFLSTAFFSWDILGGERSNLNFGLIGRTQPGGGLYLVARSVSLYNGLKYSSAVLASR